MFYLHCKLLVSPSTSIALHDVFFYVECHHPHNSPINPTKKFSFPFHPPRQKNFYAACIEDAAQGINLHPSTIISPTIPPAYNHRTFLRIFFILYLPFEKFYFYSTHQQPENVSCVVCIFALYLKTWAGFLLYFYTLHNQHKTCMYFFTCSS